MIGQPIDKVDNNINILNQQGNRGHDKYLSRFGNIERRVATVEGNPVAPQLLSPQANLQQLTLKASQMQPPPPPLPDLQQPAPPPPPSPRGQNNDNMVAGKAPIPGKFSGVRDQLAGWILQIDDYFVFTKMQNQVQ